MLGHGKAVLFGMWEEGTHMCSFSWLCVIMGERATPMNFQRILLSKSSSILLGEDLA